MAKKLQETIGIGRRKTAVSQVRFRKGSGQIDVNGRKFEEYFPLQLQRDLILAPIQKFSDTQKVDLIIRVKGGGIEAQATATRLGISRALVQEDDALRSSLKELGYLTRDPRKKERKKYGLRGARRRFQFSKR
ncbi:MAG: 30S ribosomal protein S9 [Chlamydiae bacterium RIFCSPHIGHO2_12_FULL_44_59]|nr:MAG: 30S ribosomal protein S9 [Chlamydiae bacterium RIFCSPHIGHO2_01_FULL_44_39]OGN60684.1 MAG: 30S ribosomal protein S9 [Chlamydiae bacterium RIFCSPHIGHO2_12_FULL_44_59]OGN66944.1 MAG: 30S ribosomal protein S9 [Chlamydiae bacterium RIFCSPLOWO2_01_FULL_44_52]OGN67495.1 MAG: 30S ribosomal protein S9 [Chlamydiae bacterium RIFCSPLOWO2_02_FULL_45_22]OGN71197.1 MAG: 30S ribosomal protein S9 [Chlamydiae bacterium RIFCSPLOWO2_12_FULL_45_20]